jgi:diguanylate cyclase (GGDEF)-like protein/PAS domain S-box-containing protein
MDFIAEHKIATSVIVLSGHTGIDAPIGALKRGAYGYLRKPYSPEELLNTIRNALDKRQLEADNARITWQLQCSERLYRHLVDHSPDIIYTLDQEGRFTFINDRALKTLGFAQEELYGRHYTFLVHEEDLGKAEDAFGEHHALGHSRNIELRLKSRHRKEGRIFDHRLMTVSFATADGSLSAQEIQGTYVVARDITERRQAEDAISYHAQHDMLTRLPNRALFKERLRLAILDARHSQTQLAVLYVDLDRFKLVNDMLGHSKGDQLLQEVASRLKTALSPEDIVARMGSDEFILLLPRLQRPQDATDIAQKCMTSLQQAFSLNDEEIHMSASIGIAMYPLDGQSADELVRHADIAMEHVKTQGRNNHSFFDGSMSAATRLKVHQEKNLRRALELNQLEMYYQPQIDIVSGRIVGAEALMRWNHPEHGVLSAGVFLPAAEENGLILPLSDWMIEAVCRDILSVRASACEPLRLAMNLSPQYLDRVDFCQKLQQALARHDIAPGQIEVEITENIGIRDPQNAVEQLNRLRQLGVSVAIDDFGTGYSSLAYLHRLPIHTLKIDQSFVQEIQDGRHQFPVVTAIISIARGLGLKLIAEGVETGMQAQYLTEAGCHIMQGYYFHQPMPLRELIKLLPPVLVNVSAA